ncbi:MAG: CapA family protein [Chloroflexi bacterium]|nr:CapA family protein [Chloroflexota bacterium]
MANQAISLYAVGDISPSRATPDDLFDLARPVLKEADITFAQLEGTYSEKGAPQIYRPVALHISPRNLSAVKNAGFNIVSCAGNHNLDYGLEAFVDSIENVRAAGVAVIGAGKDLNEARKPAIMQVRGARVGFLGRIAIVPPNYNVDISKPGMAQLRVATAYERREFDQPGLPPRIYTIPREEDVKEIIEDIEKLRPQVDVLVWSCHWGVQHARGMVADYQKQVGHMVIDAGADLILGHHPHLLHAIEVYRGKAIFYSMGNFAFDAYAIVPKEIIEKYGPYNVPEEIRRRGRERNRERWGIDEEYDPDYPTNQHPPVSRNTVIVKCSIVDKKIQRISIVPVLLNKKGQPEPLSAASQAGAEVVKFQEESSKEFGTKLIIEGDEATVIES